MTVTRRRALGLLLAATAVAGCGDGPPAATPATPAKPDAALVAVPFQNRTDVPAQRFQTKLINGSTERFEVVGVQFVWAGLTSEVGERTAIVVPGQRVDLPLPLPAATCAGDGSEASMPGLGDAHVRLLLADGTERKVPVVDRDGVARRLYLQDCERQRIEAAVEITWTGLREDTLEGRPVSRGALTVERRGATGAVTVVEVGSTVVFDPEPLAPDDGAVVRLEPGATRASGEVWFLESRCDPHALSEASQAFVFVLRIDLGDGVLLPFTVVAPAEAQGPMRATLTAGCDELGKIRPFDPDSGH